MEIKPLELAAGKTSGGKAAGLQKLIKLGINVPDGFVIVLPEEPRLNQEILAMHLKRLGPGLKVVRSSALAEDGNQNSFAGQFESYLGLSSQEDIMDAIKKCIQSAGTQRVSEYSKHRSPYQIDEGLRISVIVQNMIEARVSGVLFTANPVSGRRDKILINAIAGIGESLMAGHSDAIQYEIFKSGKNISLETGKKNLLSENELKSLLETAVATEEKLGYPLDMEWAIDKNGTLFWLQARPVTALPTVHFNELDTKPESKDQIWTLGNVGEMMPGAITPLTFSVSAYTIEEGMYLFVRAARAFRGKYEGWRYIQMFYNRLFFNVSNLYDFTRNVWMNQKSNVELTVVGSILPGDKLEYESILPVRIINFFRQLAALNTSARMEKKLLKMAASYTIEHSDDTGKLYLRLCRARKDMIKAFYMHYICSAQSGTLYSAIISILTGNKRKPTAEDHSLATVLVSDIKNVESADAVSSLELLAALINKDEKFRIDFIAGDNAKALEMLNNDNGQIGQLFIRFIERHGHRCVKESELREKTWSDEPNKLTNILQEKVRLGKATEIKTERKADTHDHLQKIHGVKRMFIKSLAGTARKAVARRENTKSASVRILHKIRLAYRHLSEILVQQGLLDDTDQIFFLTHDEIGALISERSQTWKPICNARREQQQHLEDLVFEDVIYGIPEPIENQVSPINDLAVLQGIPVSRGIITGPARIVNSLEEANHLQKGEIMIVSFTDVGWSPYFALISGLVTEIGSPLSHGAVVAREYGIPAVVSVKGARQMLKTGDTIILNGDKGTIEKCIN
jgi:rifampicin phosphotransferase